MSNAYARRPFSVIHNLTIGALVFALCSPACLAAYIEFEGYDGYNGTPNGGTIASVGTGPQNPWNLSYAYRYIDGWNHPPRVDSSQYSAGGWSPGGHAGTATDLMGWTSLDSASPGRYVYDFDGFELDSVVFDTNFASPTYGWEYRTYTGTGSWSILDTATSSTVATGTVDSMEVDVFSDPWNAGANPQILSRGVLTLQDDGGAFYNEMVSVFGTDQLFFDSIAPQEEPVQAVNFTQPLDQQWGIFDTNTRMQPLEVAAVPLPAAFWFLFSGSAALLGVSFRTRTAKRSCGG